MRRADWSESIEGLRGTAEFAQPQLPLCSLSLSLSPGRKEDGVCQDAVVFSVAFAPERFLQRRLLVVFSHRRDREEMFHRGDPGRDHDYR